MKNIYRVTRPAWATVDKSEKIIIAAASLLVGIYGGWGEELADVILGDRINRPSLHRIWPLIDVIVVTLGCYLLIKLYKKLRVGCYPSTFIYCFYMPTESNPNGKSQVVGYCYLDPEMDNGDIHSEGASYVWENGRLYDPVRFTSTHVYGTKHNDEVTCYIRFNINKEDEAKRFYRHGVLQFRLTSYTGVEQHVDGYAGYLQSTNEDLQDTKVRAKGYAEWYCRGHLTRDRVDDTLVKNGSLLFGKLDTLKNAAPLPSLWEVEDYMEKTVLNVWGIKIPSPQSVILNQRLRPYVSDYLSKVLQLFGMEKDAINRFQRLAVDKATAELEDTLAYERALKQNLTGMLKPKYEDRALNERAKIICDQIAPYCDGGSSLLDIGCGNGLVSNRLRSRFGLVQLLDVVEYLPESLDLPFVKYVEGAPLPVDKSFDIVLLLTVLHHSEKPDKLLEMAWAVTKKRLIIIESVVGVHMVNPAVKYELVDVDDEGQIGFAAFVDWFYNRVLHDGVPVPYNFTTPETWEVMFSRYKMRCSHVVHLGQDIDIGPECHVLFVLEK